MIRGIVQDFEWNRKYYGHRKFKRANGSTNKFYVATNSDFTDAVEITPEEHSTVGEQYYRAFGR